MDSFALVSSGTYPTPTPSALQRAGFISTFGLFGDVPVTLITRAISILFKFCKLQYVKIGN